MSSNGERDDDESELDMFEQMVEEVESFDDFVAFLDKLIGVIREDDELFETLIVNYFAQMKSNITFARAVAEANPEQGPAFPDQPDWSDVADLLLSAAMEI